MARRFRRRTRGRARRSFRRRRFVPRVPRRFNDAELRSFLFTQTFQSNLTLVAPGDTYINNTVTNWSSLLAGSLTTAVPSQVAFGQTTNARFYAACLMYDSLRLISLSVTIRPAGTPFSGTSIQGLSPFGPVLMCFASWDRYGQSPAVSSTTSALEQCRDDPSARYRGWGAGSEPQALWHRVTAIRRDFNNFINIGTNPTLSTVVIPTNPSSASYSPFSPNLLLSITLPDPVGTEPSPFDLPVIVMVRARVMFQGSRSGIL